MRTALVLSALWTAFVPPASASAAPPTMDKALILLQAERYAAAAEALEEITRAQPANSMAWFNYAFALQAEGKLDEAIEINRKAAEFPDIRATALYNIACALALKGDRERAFEALAEAQGAGFYDLDHMKRDPDLEILRRDERFEMLRGYEFKRIAMSDGSALEYGLVLPEDFDPSATYPVLIAFPPGSQSRAAAETGLRLFWGQHAAKRGWIAVSMVKPQAGWYKNRSEDYARRLLDVLDEKYHVEGGKFHIAGCSGGGPSAFHVALDSPERFQSLSGIPGYPRRQTDFDRLERLKGIRVNLHAGSRDAGWLRNLRRTHERLEEIGVESNLHVYSGEDHLMKSMLDGGFMESLDRLRSENED